MDRERMMFLAKRYLEMRIASIKGVLDSSTLVTYPDLADALADYQQELQELKDLSLIGTGAEEGHW